MADWYFYSMTYYVISLYWHVLRHIVRTQSQIIIDFASGKRIQLIHKNPPGVGKQSAAAEAPPSWLDDDDDVCAVCTADLIHLERLRTPRARVMAVPNLVSPPLSFLCSRS